MNEIDGETVFSVAETNTIDNSRRLKRLGHEVKSEILDYHAYAYILIILTRH